MKRQWLHDLAKFGAGLVVADFITLWWLSMQTRVPAIFLGLPLGPDVIGPAMTVDFFIFLILLHYGWNVGQIPHMKERMYLTFAGAIFTVVAFAHLYRVVYTGDVSIFGWDVPVFVSWIGVAVATYLAYTSFHLASSMKGSRR